MPQASQPCHDGPIPSKPSITEPPLTVSAHRIIQEIEKDLIFFDESGGGVTFSGGEPLVQHKFLMTLLNKCREREIHTAVDTSGHAPWPVMEKIAGTADLILFDIKPISRDLHTRTTGVSNQTILNNLENLKLLHGGRADIRLRLPLIPDITDTRENIDACLDFLLNLTIFRKMDILPFHKAGEAKYDGLGMKNQMAEARPIDQEKIESIKKLFERNGFNVSIGG